MEVIHLELSLPGILSPQTKITLFILYAVYISAPATPESEELSLMSMVAGLQASNARIGFISEGAQVRIRTNASIPSEAFCFEKEKGLLSETFNPRRFALSLCQ
jgi:hypothetical protein